MTPARLGIAVALCFTLIGCGGGGSHADSADQATISQGSVTGAGSGTPSPDREVIGEGSQTATCTGAMGGPGESDWRRLATSAGRFGVYGNGRDFRTAPVQGRAGFSGLRERHVQGPFRSTKTPFVVEGTEPVTVAIAPSDRRRAGLVAGIPFGGGPYAEIRLIPCRDQPRTWWPAGWVLRDQGQVTVSVRPDGGPESQLAVGRP